MQLIKTQHFKIGGKLCLHTLYNSPYILTPTSVYVYHCHSVPSKNPLVGQQKDKPQLQTNNNIFPSQLIFVR